MSSGDPGEHGGIDCPGENSFSAEYQSRLE